MTVSVILVNLALTVLVEGVLMAALFRRLNFVYYTILCNMLTNPALNLALFLVVKLLGENYIEAVHYPAALLMLELLVVCVEAGVLRLLCRFGWRRAALVSLLLNCASFFWQGV